MFRWLNRRLVAWVERWQQKQIERLYEEGCRLKAEVQRQLGHEIVLSTEERQRLRELAKGIDPEVLKRICLFDLEEPAPSSSGDTSTESP